MFIRLNRKLYQDNAYLSDSVLHTSNNNYYCHHHSGDYTIDTEWNCCKCRKPQISQITKK